MTSELLLNITICFVITLSSFAFAWVLARSEPEHDKKSRPAMWSLIIIWSMVGITYLPTTIRMIALYLNNLGLDLIMYNIAAIPFAVVSVPLVYFIIYIIVSNRKISGLASLGFTLFGAAYLALSYSSGVIGPKVTEWGSLYSINSDIAHNIYLIGLFVIPTAMIIGRLFIILLQRVPRRLHYHTTLLLVAISFVFDFMLTDVITIFDVMQVVSRLFILIGTVLAFLAYFPATTLKQKFGINEQHY